MSKKQNIWTITINDGFDSYTCEFSGIGHASIMDVMEVAKMRLEGKLLREWVGEMSDDPSTK